jgi:hypothetical protein
MINIMTAEEMAEDRADDCEHQSDAQTDRIDEHVHKTSLSYCQSELNPNLPPKQVRNKRRVCL